MSQEKSVTRGGSSITCCTYARNANRELVEHTDDGSRGSARRRRPGEDEKTECLNGEIVNSCACAM